MNLSIHRALVTLVTKGGEVEKEARLCALALPRELRAALDHAELELRESPTRAGVSPIRMAAALDDGVVDRSEDGT